MYATLCEDSEPQFSVVETRRPAIDLITQFDIGEFNGICIRQACMGATSMEHAGQSVRLSRGKMPKD